MSNYPSQEPSNYTGIDTFGGVNWSLNASRLANNESTVMENFVIEESGVLSKRRGIKAITKVATQVKIYNMITYKTKLIFATQLGLYEYNSTTNTSTRIYSGTCEATVNLFIMNDILYALTGVSFVKYDGTTVTKVEDSAYIPLLFIACNPNGNGTPLEQWNLISNKFKQSFNGDGTSAIFFGCKGNCQVTEVLVNGTAIASNGYTELTDKFTTEVRLTAVPSKGVDNVVITFQAKPLSALDLKATENKAKINKGVLYSFYGGQNDTRLLLGGSDSVFYRSAVYNPYYFPENYYQAVGDTQEKITGFVTQYDYCVILKERSIWYTKIDMLQDGSVVYSTKPLNSQVGCINPKSVQLVENSPMFLSKKGITVVNQTQVRDERNVTVISNRINSTKEKSTYGLTDELLSRGSTIDFDNKYMYANSNKIYVYDYKNDIFYIWKFDTQIVIMCMAEVNGELYFGSDNGIIYKYKAPGERGSFNNSTSLTYEDEYLTDFGTTIIKPYSCYWKSKLFSFDNYSRYKLIENLFISTSPAEKTSVTIKYVTENNAVIDIGTSFNTLIDYSTVDYGTFSYTSTYFPVIDNFKVRAKKIVFFQIVLENSNPSESLEIYSLGIKYKYQREVKA